MQGVESLGIFAAAMMRFGLIAFSVAAIFCSTVAFSQDKVVAAPSSKPALDHSVYDKWETLGGYAITDDGRWISFYSNKEENDGKVTVMNLKTNVTVTVPRGSRTKFSPGGKHLVLTIRPTHAQLKEAKLKKLKGDKLPKDTLGILELATGKISKFPALKSVEVPREGGSFIAFKVEHKQPLPSNNDTVPDKSSKSKNKPKTEVITLVYDLNRNAVCDTLKDVDVLSFTKNGDRLLCIAKGKDSLGKEYKELYSYDPVSGSSTSVLKTGKKGDIMKPYLSANEKFIAFYANTDTTRKLDENVEIYTFDLYAQGAAAQRVADNSLKGIPEGMILTRNRALNFNEAGDRLFFGITKVQPKKDTTNKEEQAKVDVWHYNDDFISTQQLNQKNMLLKRSYLSWISLDTNTRKAASGELVRLAQPEYHNITVPAEWSAEYAYSFSSERYNKRSQWDANPVCDLYLISLKDGSSRMVAREIYASNISASPEGNFLVWYNPEHKQFYSLDLRGANKAMGEGIHTAGEPVCITSGIHFPLWKESHDKPQMAPAYGNGGWSADEATFYVYDKYDVWEVDPLAQRAPVMLTQGLGREKGYTFKMMRWDALQLPDGTPGIKKEPIGKRDNVYFTAFDNKSKGTGYYIRENRKGRLMPMRELIMEPDFALGYLNKAKDANVITYTKGNFVESTNLWVTDNLFKTSRKLTNSNPQQADYNWGTCESVYWNAHDGRELEGLLYKPEDFDPAKQYPMVVYFYETSSQYKHSYRKPAVSRSTINITYFVSNGYLVFMPDIHYIVGHPGKSAYNCIVSGVEELCKNPWVDKDNVAIQGQSWGGYQVAYLVTQTDMFKCAGSGAPVANMTSAYGGIRWGSGVVRHFQYEHTQSRIGKTLWDEGGLELYLENSPLFFAHKVNTPLLIMHNDADEAVPWYQGIEYFTALRRLGKQVWMLQYNDESHNISKRVNALDYTIRLSQFMDHFLKGAPMPVWMKYGLPATHKGVDMGLELIEE